MTTAALVRGEVSEPGLLSDVREHRREHTRVPRRGLGAPASARATTVAFAGLCVITALARMWLFASPGAPAGVDGGSWLAFGGDLLGHEARLGDPTYPPVVPLLVTGFVELFGASRGTALVAAVSAIAPAIGAFTVLRLSGLRWAAVLLSAPVLASTASGEMASWGGYPQLLASPAVVIGLWFLSRWLDSGDPASLMAAALAGSTVLAVSHFAALLGALGAAAIVVWRSAMTLDRAKILRRVGTASAIGLLLSLPLLPVYARLLPAVLASRGAEPALAELSWAELPTRFASVHGAAWGVWVVGLGIAIWALVARRDPEAQPLRLVAGAVVFGLVGAFVLSGEPRLLHEVPGAAAIGLGVWFVGRPDMSRSRGVVTVCLFLALTVVAAAGIVTAAPSRERFHVLTPELVEAIDWIADETPRASRIGVPSLKDAPLGWWIEGLAGRPTISGAPLRWVIFPEERRLAAAANKLFFVIGMPTEEGMREARSLGLDYVLLPKGSFTYDPALVRDYLRGEPPAFENADALILAVPDPAPSVESSAR